MNVKKLSMFEHEVRVLSFSSLKLFLATMAKREVWDALQSFELKCAVSSISIKKGTPIGVPFNYLRGVN